MTRTYQSYHVDWFVNGDVVHQNVTVHIADGRLMEIESGRSAAAISLGSVALIPGLVNAHTHLEFSLLERPIPTAGRFTDWIRSVVAHRREHPTSVPEAVRRGVRESVRSGTTLIGDIATVGWSITDYVESQFAGVVFQELLGLSDERVAAQSELAQSLISKVWTESDTNLFGLSPHAPYSVRPDLLQRAVAIAKATETPLAMHLAETPAELELLADGTGEFREMLTDFGIWRDGLFGGKTPADYLAVLAECPRSLVVHGNYLTENDLQFLARHPQMTLVYCPRTHAAFGHPPHPWRRLVELGGSVAIGTDSRASNPDLSLFAELQFVAKQHPDLSHLEILKLGTHNGRRALLGEIADQNHADFCVVQWEEGLTPDPVSNLFAAGNRIIGTIVDGADLVSADPATRN
ncbi:MAG: S-adenosylhomocysteine deaminase [Schlesneria sp.]|nr:S-adenosylhomocysteine deaminase [Schlesneria sp.]